MPSVVLVTGLSGSGKTTVLRALEDVGWFCIDNLPVVLLPKVVELAREGDGSLRVALVVDVRERRFLADAGRIVDELRQQDVHLDVVYLDADDESLLRRFRETRRRHPLSDDGDLREAFAEERELLSELHLRASLTLDTTRQTVHDLKRLVQDHFATGHDDRLRIRLVSFGFKHGALTEADLLFDARFLPNPHFEPELRYRTGLDTDVSSYVRDRDDTREFERLLGEMLGFLLPRYAAEGKTYLTVGVGCTGGQHRSVAIVEALRVTLSEGGHDVHVEHRDQDHWRTQPPDAGGTT